VREPPADLPIALLRDALATDYELAATDITFLPVGHDAHAWAFRADTRGDASYFLKVRHRITNEAGLVIPHFLREGGVARVVAPLASKRGTLWATPGDYALAVYQFISGATGLTAGMSDRQWIEYGATLRAIHEVVPSSAVRALLRRENFVPDGAAAIRTLDEHVSSGTLNDPGRALIAEFWLERRDLIRNLVARAEELGRRLADSQPALVLCHADIHTNNVLLDGDDRIWIVDWDETMLAPRERDLMFVIGGIAREFVSPPQEELFFVGYGTVSVDQVALAYYRYAWTTSDIGAYGAEVFQRDDLGPLDRVEAVERFQSLFAPGGIVDIALGSRMPD